MPAADDNKDDEIDRIGSTQMDIDVNTQISIRDQIELASMGKSAKSNVLDAIDEIQYEKIDLCVESEDKNVDAELDIPSKFICPITKQIIRKPENVHERLTIDKYLKEKGTSPMTGEEAYTLILSSNKQLRKQIEEYCLLNNISY